MTIAPRLGLKARRRTPGGPSAPEDAGLVAVYFLAVLNNGLNLMGVQPYVSSFVNGGALIVGVGMANYLGWKRRGS